MNSILRSINCAEWEEVKVSILNSQDNFLLFVNKRESTIDINHTDPKTIMLSEVRPKEKYVYSYKTQTSQKVGQ